MNKEELEREIIRTKEQLTKLQQALKDKEYERWKPVHLERYFTVNANNKVDSGYNCTQDITDEHLKVFNCFKTVAEAEAEAEKILVRRMLEDIVARLNKDNKPDWDDIRQNKYQITYNYYEKDIDYLISTKIKHQGTVYSTNKNFIYIAIKEIGKERLERYLKGE